ncbi:MAG TPA: type II toxin-antitoxin system HicB family antitoxin [Candidatus Hydrogenedentes bacterium]|nr:type II toxin-antitoxin system HicB family antitoxin [Candidatus Hydrogenedentota bacterium]
MSIMRFQAIIEQDEDGYFVVDVPALQGCHTQGKTYEEAMSNIQEVVSMCIREMKEDGVNIEARYPEIIGIKTLEVAV